MSENNPVSGSETPAARPNSEGNSGGSGEFEGFSQHAIHDDLDSFYRATIKGQIRAFQNVDHPEELVTPYNNTLLHVHITSATKTTASANFVKALLERCPALAWKVNVKDETLLHIASRYGREDIVHILLTGSENTYQRGLEHGVGGASEMLRMTSKVRETALHEAARYNHLAVARMLIQTDPSCPYTANVTGETPLYLAVERGFLGVALAILDGCESPDHGGPNGRNTLHAAALLSDLDMTKLILNEKSTRWSLLIKQDEKGWTPLHYAARFGCWNVVRHYINYDSVKCLGYITSKTGKIALHIAARHGEVDIIEEISEHYLGCCELVDHRGRNVVHFAVRNTDDDAIESIEFVLSNKLFSNLINDKDAQGKRPIDLVASKSYRKLFKKSKQVDRLALDTFSAKALREMDQPSVDDEEDDRDVDKKNIDEKAKEAHLVVAALIATVTFAAGFTLPGGYKGDGNPDEGSPILSKSSAFKAFLIIDTIALALSAAVVILNLDIGNKRKEGKPKLARSFYKRESVIIIIALYAMIAAFVAGTYATLAHSSDIAIATSVIACVFFVSSGLLETFILKMGERLLELLGYLIGSLIALCMCCCCCCFCMITSLATKNAQGRCLHRMERISEKINARAQMSENISASGRETPASMPDSEGNSGVSGESEGFSLHVLRNLLLDIWHREIIKGQIKALQNVDLPEELLTPYNNTLLHVHILSATKTTASTNFVKAVLERCPTLLWKVNSKDETLLHIASRYGREDVVHILLTESENTHQRDLEHALGGAKEMLRMTNKVRDTALHEAARYNHLAVARMLIETDPSCPYTTNVTGETPLYLSVERGFLGVALAILDGCESPDHGGPNGRNTLHVAALRSDLDMAKLILNEKSTRWSLLKKQDEKGWTPLHYTARFGCWNVAKHFIKFDSEKYLGYITSKTGKTALHIAARHGEDHIMEEISKHYPGCCELVDNRERNVIHFAVQSKDDDAIEFVLSNKLFGNLINDKDAQGKKPIDLVASKSYRKLFKKSNRVDRLALDNFSTKALLEMDRPSADDEKDDQNVKEEKIDEKAKEAHLVVAALIATVTFAAGFTLPGGYKGDGNPDEGSPILSKSSAFKAFVIIDTIALALSGSVVILNLHIANLHKKGKVKLARTIYKRESEIIIIALHTMMAAFVAGTYATLAHSSIIAIVISVVAFILFLFSVFLGPLMLKLGERLGQLLGYLIGSLITLCLCCCCCCLCMISCLMTKKAQERCLHRSERINAKVHARLRRHDW